MRSNHLVNIFQYQITVNIASLFAPHFSSTKFWIFLVTNHAIRYCSQLGQSSKFWGTVTGWVLKDFWESRKSFSGKNCFFRGFRIWQLCPFYQVINVLFNSTFEKNVQFWIAGYNLFVPDRSESDPGLSDTPGQVAAISSTDPTPDTITGDNQHLDTHWVFWH